MGPDFDGHGFHGPHGGFGGPDGFGGFDGFAGLPWMPLVPFLLALVIVLATMWLVRSEPSLLPWTRTAPDPVRARWDDAVERHHATMRAYAAFECDIAEVLRLPGLADVTQPATGRFIDAFAEAGALRTDAFPGPEFAPRFIVAAEHAHRAWTAAVEAAQRTRDARFDPRERALLDQVRTLLDVIGSSAFEAERRTAFRQARRRLAELERRTGWRLPHPAATELEHRARAELAAA
jgi:hypothetical protein